MRLSEAIILGSATCKLEPRNIDSCALGSALNAMGIPPQAVPADVPVYRYLELRRLWPWLSEEGGLEAPLTSTAWKIFRLFDCDVCDGTMTLDQLADYVCSIEPDCDCCRFECDCKEKEDRDGNQKNEYQAQESNRTA